MLKHLNNSLTIFRILIFHTNNHSKFPLPMASSNPNHTRFLRSHKDEVQKIHTKSANVTSESVSKTREMLKHVNECKDAGQNTLQNLYEQGDSLNRTERALDDTSENLDRAKIRIKNMETATRAPCCCAPCIPWFQKNPDRPRHRHSILKNEIENEKMKANQDEKPVSTVLAPRNIGADSNNGRFFPKVLGNEDEDEIESNLTHVSHHLVGLKGMVIEMGSEADRQNEQLDRLNDKTEKSIVKVDEATKRTADLVNDKNNKTTCCFCCS